MAQRKQVKDYMLNGGLLGHKFITAHPEEPEIYTFVEDDIEGYYKRYWWRGDSFSRV